MTTDTHVRAAGVWRTITGLSARAGGVWRTAKFKYVRSSGSWRIAYSYIRAVFSGTTSASEINTGGGPVSVSLAFHPDGSVVGTQPVSGPVLIGYWGAPSGGSPGVDFWLTATVTASNGVGTFTGTVGSAQQLSSARAYSLSIPGLSTATRSLLITISADSAGAYPIGSATYTMSAVSTDAGGGA